MHLRAILAGTAMLGDMKLQSGDTCSCMPSVGHAIADLSRRLFAKKGQLHSRATLAVASLVPDI